ncbi:UrcA family protein [Altererythrobacter sp. KTW20L]|uniref:UrcA family protein n=1 Tax=Altererythrobacter sp. KTW20L TaxID=2942210 RepID=UPI0020BD8C84|nr:UrcA family protein [Altererythrobacter sp. KTW20L]MCL6249977.1 UrcA family protein [Altererythrobacter sp. KTW20L]
MFKTISIALAGAALLATGSVAALERDTRTTGVTYRDLDLATEEGRNELNRRIDSAAKQVCGMNERQTGSHIVPRDARECYRNAKRDLQSHFARVLADGARAG